jgi:hypothetical protein
MAALIRQFRDVDSCIRAIDTAAAALAAAEADDDADDADEQGWDESRL